MNSEIQHWVACLSAYNVALRVISARRVQLDVHVIENSSLGMSDVHDFLASLGFSFESARFFEIDRAGYFKILFDDVFSRVDSLDVNMKKDFRWYLEDYYQMLAGALSEEEFDVFCDCKMYNSSFLPLCPGLVISVAAYKSHKIINIIDYS